MVKKLNINVKESIQQIKVEIDNIIDPITDPIINREILLRMVERYLELRVQRNENIIDDR